MPPIKVLTPTCTLGYGFGEQALKRGMAWGPDVIAVDAGSTDPGPHYLGSGETLVSDFGIKRELTELICAARQAKIPMIVGSAARAGARSPVATTVNLVMEVARECGLSFRLSCLYSDIPHEV